MKLLHCIKADLLSNLKTSVNFEFATKCKMVSIKDAWLDVASFVLALWIKLKKIELP